jgi:DNA-binding SARP family transcriptional activator/tetratricopeptide (TPR) repeat protein
MATTRPEAELVIRLAGPFTVLRKGGRPIPGAELGSRKARLLLKLLAVEAGRALPVAHLVDVIWSGTPPPAGAVENVATLVSRLRRSLGPEAIEGSREEGYRLGRPPAVVVDLDSARDWLAQSRSRLVAGEGGLALAAAEHAVDLVGGGSALEDEPDAEWAEPARERLESLRPKAFLALAAAALESGDARRAADAAGNALDADPYDEAACRLLMRAAAAVGEPGRALAAYAALSERLAEELGADPAAETQAVHVALLRDEPLPGNEARRLRTDAGPESLGLVGRAEELRVLRKHWNAAAAGAGSLVLVEGEAGIGKTRLCEELVGIVASTGGLTVRARCHEAERSLFLQPVVEAVSAAVRTLSPELTRGAAGVDAAVLAGLVPEAVGVLDAPAASGRASVQVERRRAFEAVTGFIRRLAERSPLLVLLDDLHTAGRETVELLHYLARHVATSRVLLVATLRSEEGHEAIDLLADQATLLDVPPLPLEAVTRLAEAAGRPDLAEPIHHRTGGHALFVVESLRSLVAGEEGVPASLQSAVLARVRRAAPGVEELLRAGAVLGSSFDPTTAARLIGDTVPVVLSRCEDARAARLLVPSGRQYEFANDLVREVLYAATAVPVRAAYHSQAADLLTEWPESVATHAIAIGDWSRAARALLLAGEQALERLAARDADDLLSRCLDIASHETDPDVRGRALLTRAHAREARAAYTAVMDDLEEACAVARETGDRRLEMLALRALGGEAAIGLGLPIERSAAHLERGLALATALGDRTMEASILAWLAVLTTNALRFDEAVEFGRRAVAAARLSTDETALMAALDGRKTALAYLGEVAELMPVIEELEPLVRRLGDPLRLHWTIFESGFASVAAGDWTEAAGRFQRALDLCQRSGHAAYAPWYLAHLGWLERLQGNETRALELGRSSIELSEEFPHAWCGATAAGFHGSTLIQVGRTAEAVRVLEHGAGLADKTGSESYLLRCLAPLAEATGSRELLEQADGLLAAVRTPPGSAWMTGDFAYLAVARAWLAAGDPTRAREVLAPMLGVAERVPWVSSLAEGSLVDARAALALGRTEEAERLLVRAADLAGRYGLAQVAASARSGPASG